MLYTKRWRCDIRCQTNTRIITINHLHRFIYLEERPSEKYYLSG